MNLNLSTILLIPCIFLSFLSAEAQSVDAMLDVGTHSLHFRVVPGTGTPILFEAGNGDNGDVWEPMIRKISQATGAPLIVYDRAGLGKSEIDTNRTGLKKEVRSLEKALLQLGIQKEVFLVTHSFGSVYGTEFARRGRFKVLGAVFIEPALPCSFTADWAKGFVNSISSSDWGMIKKHRLGLYYVLKDLEKIAGRMARKPAPASLPITLIAAEIPQAMLKPEEVNLWARCLKDFGESPNHRYVLAEGCSHKIWKEDLELVIDEILRSYQAMQN